MHSAALDSQAQVARLSRMKVLATADLHGVLPDVPECDLLVIAGDVCPDLPMPGGVGYAGGVKQGQWRQLDWLNEDFRKWLRAIPATDIVGIAGNHDFIFENRQAVRQLDLPWTYLLDRVVTVQGLNIFGTPWVPVLQNWAFYASEQALQTRVGAIPPRVDILLSHGPPHGLRDLTVPMFGSMHAGDKPLAEALDDLAPKTFVCGHIHEGFGVEETKGGVPVYNVALNNERYEPVNPIVELTELSYA